MERQSICCESVQRFFSTFPARLPGVALLLLRTVAGAAAVLDAAAFLTHVAEPSTATWAIGLLAIVSAIALIAGFLTPPAALAVSVTTLFVALDWAPPTGIRVNDPAATVLLIANAAALALLGPGAHSIDAYLFGRREIIIPDDRSHR
jgi:uncharacterized membrane protein YphA (DoxX/SURF4 family)